MEKMEKIELNKSRIGQLIPVTILILSFYTIIPYLKPEIPLLSFFNNSSLWWGISFAILLVFFFSRYRYFDKLDGDNMLVVWIYLFWNLVCIARALFESELKWEWNGGTNNVLALLLPIVVFTATHKMVVQSLFIYYIRYALPLFAILALFITTDAYGYYLLPVAVLIIFFPAFSRRQSIFILFLSLLVLLTDLGNRHHILVFGLPFLILIIYYLRDKISVRVLEMFRLTLLFVPLLMFLLMATIRFNVPADHSNEINPVAMVTNNGVFDKSILYLEAFKSAINEKNWLLGQTPNRGVGSNITPAAADAVLVMGSQTGNDMELSHLFTWTGLMGLMLYYFIFLRATFLAVNRSNNTYVKMVGIFVAFRWLYAWVEEVNNFTINNFLLMILLGICFSHSFRKMNNNEMQTWVRGMFDLRFFRPVYPIAERGELEVKLNANTGSTEEKKKIII